MGCKYPKLISNERVVAKKLNDTGSNEPQATIIEEILQESNEPKTSTNVVFRAPLVRSNQLTDQDDLKVLSIITNASETISEQEDNLRSTRSIRRTKPDDSPEAVTKEPSDKSGKPNLFNNAIVSSTPIDSKEPSILRENFLRSLTVNSNISSISEDSITTAISNESDRSYSVYYYISSSSTDLENIAHGEDAISRLMSMNPTRSSTRQQSIHNDIRCESNKSYSLRVSNVSEVSTDSEESLKQQATIVKSNIQKIPIANETSTKSDEPDLHHAPVNRSIPNDLKAMKENLVTVLRVTSTKLSNPDTHKKPNISETSSESDEL